MDLEPIMLLIQDVQRDYLALRMSGESRAGAIAALNTLYANELTDGEESPGIHIGIALALSRKGELTREIQAAANGAMEELAKKAGSSRLLSRYNRIVNAPISLGEEAQYRIRKRYAPNWTVGDLFAHRLSCPASASAEIQNWYIVFYKAGEYTDNLLWQNQLMYVLLCPPCDEGQIMYNIKDLTYLPVMDRGKKADYLVQFQIHNRKEEQLYALQKIGIIPHMVRPLNCAEENPYTAYPLYAQHTGGAQWPDYEETICRLYCRLRSRQEKSRYV